jgi:hypothetical protein
MYGYLEINGTKQQIKIYSQWVKNQDVVSYVLQFITRWFWQKKTTIKLVIWTYEW